MDYNGGALIAMKGKNCVAIASDKRFGVNQVLILQLDLFSAFHSSENVIFRSL